MNNINDVIILGSGPAGLTAAIYAARASLNPVIISGPLPHGQLVTTTHVENFPGFPKGVMGPELMELMESQAKEFGTKVFEDTILKIEKVPHTTSTGHKTDIFLLRGSKNKEGGEGYLTKSVIIATGAASKRLGLKSEMELTGFGVSTCATCDGAFFKNKVITVVGGGDSALEEAIFLTRFASKLNLVHRREEFRGSKIMQERALKNEKITPIWNSAITEIIGDKKVGVQKLIIKNLKTEQLSELQTDALFVAIGHSPNTDFLKGLINLDETGYIITEGVGCKTNVEGIFACGDVKDKVYRQAITAAGSGCMAALEVEKYLENLH